MVEKLSFTELVRYLLTGVLIASAVAVAIPVDPEKLVQTLECHETLAGALGATTGIIVLLLIGYTTFALYRQIIYGIFILWFKIYLGEKKRYTSPREHLQNLMLEDPQKMITPWDAEMLYNLLRKEKGLDSFYSGQGVRMITGLHFLYLLSVIAICTGLWRMLTGEWGWSIVFVIVGAVLFIFALLADIRFEQLEVLLFKRNNARIRRIVKLLKDANAF